jgi:hypothetical protein
MSTPLIIAVTIGVVFLALLLWAVAVTFLRERRFAKLPPRPAFRCPTCSSEQIDILSAGLWDREDAEGRGTGGVFEFGLCKKCGSRCARFVDDDPVVPTDEQWQVHFGPMENMRRDETSWPLESRNEKTVA